MKTRPFERITSGCDGLDALLAGGLIPRRRYLLRGGPGLGKTTLGLSFLAAGAEAGDGALMIGFQEPEHELRANAATLGIDTDPIAFLGLSPTEEFFTRHEAYDVFAAADVERDPLVDATVEAVERHRPARVFVDSLTYLRFLAADVFQFRKQALSFLRFLTDRGATVLFTSESSREVPDDDLQFLADGIVHLERGNASPSVRIAKLRGSDFVGGRHQYRLNEQGFRVFPRMRPPQARTTDVAPGQLASGNADLDAMLGGGLEAGTVTLLTGPTGIGKSTLAATFALRAAAAGRRSAMFLFEEELDTLLWRLRALGVDVDAPRRDGTLAIEQIEPLRYLADEFMALVRERVASDGVRLVVLDSVSGLDLALASHDGIAESLHAFAKTLVRSGVSVILVNENQVDTASLAVSERDISYLADNVVVLRYLEPGGRLRKALGVLKKRLSAFDPEQREFEIGAGGLHIGPPLAEARDRDAAPGARRSR